MDQNFTTWWPLKTVVGRIFLITRAPGGTTGHLLVKKEWPKIKIYADSWVASSLREERWRDQSWYMDGAMGEGIQCEDLGITCGGCLLWTGVKQPSTHNTQSVSRQPPLCHQSSQCLNTRPSEQSHHGVQRMEAMHGSGHMSSHLLRLAREINPDSHVQHHPFRRLTSHLVWQLNCVELFPTWKKTVIYFEHFLHLYVF